MSPPSPPPATSPAKPPRRRPRPVAPAAASRRARLAARAGRPAGLACALLACLASACAASDGGGGAGGAGPREAILGLNEGLVLSTGEVVPGASYLNVDLVVYKNKDGFDLKPGSSGPGAQMAMRIFTKGGIPTAFASLDEVPADKPTNEDLYAYMRQVSNGWGAVVQHNVGEGHSRIWIAQAVASAGRLRLQWAALPN